MQSFSVPLGPGIGVNNIGFHAPLNPPAFANDGTVGSAGYSNAPWTSVQASDSLSWSSETFAQNPNANAVRWGTLYNFRFDSDHPPQTTNATIGFFKTGSVGDIAVFEANPSIIYVGIENLARGDAPKGRGALTFAFGLIHGFGFASVLRELGVSWNGSGIAVPLFSFNLGVELGKYRI